MLRKINVSIIIVNYKVKKELFACLNSIYDSKPKITLEIIVVDNDRINTLEKNLKKLFPKVRYVRSPRNLGYGGGNNLGAKYANGEYLFILNPDTEVSVDAINILYDLLKKNKKAGIAAPLLIKPDGTAYPQQGTKELTPKRAIFSLSFLSKFPFNSISKSYWQDWTVRNRKQVDVCPGTAFMISKELFSKAKGFNDDFFLYFEEFDLCNRVRKVGYGIYIEPKAKVMHIWGASTKKSQSIDKAFEKSRFLYFKKNYGLVYAVLVNYFLKINKGTILLFLILALSAFTLCYKLSSLMVLIGDQGWFYVSARDMLIHHQIPLVGITSSHTWLHQGAFWTYILAVILKLSSFSVTAGAYFTAFMGVITIYLVYKLASLLFSQKIGLLSAFIYSTSILVIQNSRSSYHTSPIPFFVILLLYFIFKWMKGDLRFFPLIFLILGILYNFEIATFSLSITFFLILAAGFVLRQKWAMGILNIKTIILSSLALLIPMMPMIIYDLHHGFPQTLKVIIWIFYKIAVRFGYPPLHPEIPTEIWGTFFPYLFNSIQQLIFNKNLLVSLLILGSSFTYLVFVAGKNWRSKKDNVSTIIILLFFAVPALSYLSTKTNSGAYFLMFFPQACIMIGVFYGFLMSKKYLLLPTLLIVLFIGLSNVVMLTKSDYFRTTTYLDKLGAGKQILEKTKGTPYNLYGRGENSQYESFLKPYEYITWQLGHPPSERNEKLKIYITETDKIKVELK